MGTMVRKVLYFLLAFLLLVDFYLIFNAGNPRSFLRIFIEDTSYDVTVTVVLSILIAVISMYMIRDNDQNSIEKIIEQNSSHIMELKNQNRSNKEIAESFLKELGAEKGFTHFLLKRRVLKYISKIK